VVVHADNAVCVSDHRQFLAFKWEKAAVNKYLNGMLSGLMATVALSLIMFAKDTMGVMPQLDVIKMLSSMIGMTQFLLVGWMAHFLIGTIVWGILFSLLVPHLPGSTYMRIGISFGVLAWSLMMVVVMPMAGAGLFGLNLTPMAPIATLVLHVIYGAVLGLVYGIDADKSVKATLNSPGQTW
jgi:hypothetical protein